MKPLVDLPCVLCFVLLRFFILHEGIFSKDFGGRENGRLFLSKTRISLGSLATDTSGKLDVLGHDGHSLGMDSTQVGILKESDEIGLAGFLEGHDG